MVVITDSPTALELLLCFLLIFLVLGIPSLPKVMVEHFSIEIVSDPSGGLISSRGRVTSSMNYFN